MKGSLEYFPNFVSILYFISWFFFGIPILLFYLMIDLYQFIKVLTRVSLTKLENIETENLIKQEKIFIYNEVLTIFIAIDEIFKL